MKRFLLTILILCLFAPVVNAVAPKDVSLYDMLPGYEPPKPGEQQNWGYSKIRETKSVYDGHGNYIGRMERYDDRYTFYDKSGKKTAVIK